MSSSFIVTILPPSSLLFLKGVVYSYLLLRDDDLSLLMYGDRLLNSNARKGYSIFYIETDSLSFWFAKFGVRDLCPYLNKSPSYLLFKYDPLLSALESWNCCKWVTTLSDFLFLWNIGTSLLVLSDVNMLHLHSFIFCSFAADILII